MSVDDHVHYWHAPGVQDYFFPLSDGSTIRIIAITQSCVHCGEVRCLHAVDLLEHPAELVGRPPEKESA